MITIRRLAVTSVLLALVLAAFPAGTGAAPTSWPAAQTDTDTDGDGLPTDQEIDLGTDPDKADTDGDRLSDGFEVREFGTDPLLADSDEDGLGDGDELETFKTDPLAADTDGDGHDDATELDAGSDPRDAASAPDPHAGATAIEVAAYLCPVDYAGADYAGECAPRAGIEVTLSRVGTEFAVSGETGADGIVGFQGLGEGRYEIALDLPGDPAFVTFCGAEGETEPRPIESPNTDRIGVELGAGEVLRCTFYAIPSDDLTLPRAGLGTTAAATAGDRRLGVAVGAALALVVLAVAIRRRTDLLSPARFPR